MSGRAFENGFELAAGIAADSLELAIQNGMLELPERRALVVWAAGMKPDEWAALGVRLQYRLRDLGLERRVYVLQGWPPAPSAGVAIAKTLPGGAAVPLDQSGIFQTYELRLASRFNVGTIEDDEIGTLPDFGCRFYTCGNDFAVYSGTSSSSKGIDTGRTDAEAYYRPRAYKDDELEPERRYQTLCPICAIGWGVQVDEDGLCSTCGAPAYGDGVNTVAAEFERLRRRLSAAKGKASFEETRAEEASRVAAKRVGADPAVRALLLREFGTTEPELLRDAIAELRAKYGKISETSDAERREKP